MLRKCGTTEGPKEEENAMKRLIKDDTLRQFIKECAVAASLVSALMFGSYGLVLLLDSMTGGKIAPFFGG